MYIKVINSRESYSCYLVWTMQHDLENFTVGKVLSTFLRISHVTLMLTKKNKNGIIFL